MGILNITPDSFYDGGKTTTEKEILSQAEKMLLEGATFLDIGGYSSRPNADDIPQSEELKRVIPAIEIVVKYFPDALISIDTFRSEVANRAIECGAAIVNDISGGDLDPNMFTTIAKLQVPYILMHMRGNAKTMATLTDYDEITHEVLKNLSGKIATARAIGINDIIADPGLGFAKTAEQSFKLLNNLELFKSLEVPYLVGASRKSFLSKTINIPPEDALNATTVMNTVALLKGASILRVHDVKEAVQSVKLLQNLNPRP